MNGRSDVQTWKVVGGTLIVAVAFAIMMPGVFDYVGRLGRLILMVLVAVAIAASVVLVRYKVMAARRNKAASVDADVQAGQNLPQ